MRVAGTGFLAAENLLLTAWHCVCTKLDDDHVYAVARYSALGDGPEEIAVLSSISQKRGGSDIATAKVDFEPIHRLPLTENIEFPRGTQVWVLGYPFEDVKRSDHGQMDITLHPRYLQGYVMHQFDFHWEHGRLDFGTDATLELDLPAPKGVSGSPLLRFDSREIIRMVFGEREAYTLLDEESDDGGEIVRGD